MTILDAIGNTPLIRLENIEKRFNLTAPLYAKAEYFNLTGSVKDRPALNILLNAERKGLIKKGDCIVEATSGNMGISLVAIGKKLGYKPVIVIPEGYSAERTTLMKAYGGEVVFSEASLGMDGAVNKAKELAFSLNGYYVDQFNNEDNYLAHYLTTGREIYETLNGSVDRFIAGIGSGGTITGVAKFLKEKKNVEIIGVEPLYSPLLSQGKAGKHSIQGIGANFKPSILNESLIDKILTVSDEDAKEFTRILCKEEGLMCGISSGAAVSASVKYLSCLKDDKVTVVLLPDGGLKYVSTGLF